MMVALFDTFDHASPDAVEIPVSIAAWDGAASADVDIRVERVSAARDAIARDRYDFDHTALDRTVDAVHRTLAITP